MRSFLAAVGCLTSVPVPPASPEAIARSRFWYPFVGTLLGAALGGLVAGLTWGLPGEPALSAFLVLVIWLALTGALHLDGWCDLCDGLWAASSPAERLHILRDPHLGAFGLAGGFVLLLGKWLALSRLGERWPAASPWLLGSAVASARCWVLCLAAGAVYPRTEGLGKILIEATANWELFLYIPLALVLSLPGAVPFGSGPVYLTVAIGLFPATMAALFLLILRCGCQRRLGGITGDCLGAGIEGCELVFLLAAAVVSCCLS